MLAPGHFAYYPRVKDVLNITKNILLHILFNIGIIYDFPLHISKKYKMMRLEIISGYILNLLKVVFFRNVNLNVS